MLKTLVFAGIAAFAGKKLYESGAIDGFVADAKSRLRAIDTRDTAPLNPAVTPTTGY